MTVVRPTAEPRVDGITPTKLLSFKRRSFRELVQKLDGTAPSKLLEDRSTFVSLGSEPKDAGIVPASLLLVALSKPRAVSFEKSVLSCPVNWLLETSICERPVSVNNVTGSEPLREFCSSFRYWSFEGKVGILPASWFLLARSRVSGLSGSNSGIAPLKLLADISSDSNFESKASEGIEPSSELLPTNRAVRDNKSPKEGGIDPFNTFFPMFRVFKEIKSPIKAGIVPVSLLEDRLISVSKSAFTALGIPPVKLLCERSMDVNEVI